MSLVGAEFASNAEKTLVDISSFLYIALFNHHYLDGYYSVSKQKSCFDVFNAVKEEVNEYFSNNYLAAKEDMHDPINQEKLIKSYYYNEKFYAIISE